MTDPANIKTGQRIRELRKAKQLTQLALATQAGIEANTLARVERGKHKASPETVEGLAKALGVKASDILGY
jgi:transcriptional regulator with XRE-family HTH domain